MTFRIEDECVHIGTFTFQIKNQKLWVAVKKMNEAQRQMLEKELVDLWGKKGLTQDQRDEVFFMVMSRNDEELVAACSPNSVLGQYTPRTHFLFWGLILCFGPRRTQARRYELYWLASTNTAFCWRTEIQT